MSRVRAAVAAFGILTAAAPARADDRGLDSIKAEVKGTVVFKVDAPPYVEVYRDEGFGLEETIRVYFRLDGEDAEKWKGVLAKLDGLPVTVTGHLGRAPKTVKLPVPKEALYFAPGFVVRAATETFK
jgi:hypothetical protein